MRQIHEIYRVFLLQCQPSLTHSSKGFSSTPKIVPRNSVVEPQVSRAVLKCTRNITSHSTPNGNSSTSLGNSLAARQPPFFSFLLLDAAFAVLAVFLSLCLSSYPAAVRSFSTSFALAAPWRLPAARSDSPGIHLEPQIFPVLSATSYPSCSPSDHHFSAIQFRASRSALSFIVLACLDVPLSSGQPNSPKSLVLCAQHDLCPRFPLHIPTTVLQFATSHS